MKKVLLACFLGLSTQMAAVAGPSLLSGGL
jgi:hypothetical protein